MSTLRLILTRMKQDETTADKSGGAGGSRSKPADIRCSRKTNTYCHGVTDDVLRDSQKKAEILRDRLDMPFSYQDACVMILLDLEDGRDLQAKADYGKRWLWGLTQVKQRWTAMLQQVYDWQTLNGKYPEKSKLPNRSVTGEQPVGNRESGDSVAESIGSNRSVTGEQPVGNRSGDKYTSYGARINSSTPNPPEEIPHTPTAARSRETTAGNPSVYRRLAQPAEPFKPPELDEVIAYGKTIGVPAPMSEAFFMRYDRQGWLFDTGLSMTSWKSSLHTWNINEASRSKKVKSHGRASNIPNEPAETDAERRARLRRAIDAQSNSGRDH